MNEFRYSDRLDPGEGHGLLLVAIPAILVGAAAGNIKTFININYICKMLTEVLVCKYLN